MNHDHLIREINQSYSLRMKQIKLHREMIGSVYLAEGGVSVMCSKYTAASKQPMPCSLYEFLTICRLIPFRL